LAVDRGLFSQRITEEIGKLPGVAIHREERSALPTEPLAIVATGPLTSDALAQDIARFVGETHLHFYDAVSPVIEADSIDMTKVFRASRYGKGTDDYLNCPMDEAEYRAFFTELMAAECSEVKDFEKEFFFEGCLPIEVIASRGPETMRFGPMKPVGLNNPATGRRPFAVVQLRQDNLAASHFSMVGFQTHLKWPEQKRIFRMIPGLENAEFIRFGMIHRNTYINSPKSLHATFEAKNRQGLFFAGQMSGVEGYVESAASGLLAGIGAASRARGEEPQAFPLDTAMGALGRYISSSDPKHYQPTNIAFGLFPELGETIRDKRLRRRALSERALTSLAAFTARGFKSVAETPPVLA
jgi:methylenetetrahydrofolate--tRNA-(uracil-5-)-methyltransferase